MWVDTFFSDTAYFQHLGDTILFLMPGHDGWYRVGHDYQIIKTNDGDSLIWDDGNLMRKEKGEAFATEFIYTGYNNPFRHVWKTFKNHHTSSRKQVEYENLPYGSYYRYVVLDSENNYPTEIDKFMSDGPDHEVYIGTYLYSYRVITDIHEIPEQLKVHSVAYFNLLGQEIEKPKEGFYIERKITDKGPVSTKFYIR
jgi:hypothetical protein